jgi:hypothetical protein
MRVGRNTILTLIAAGLLVSPAEGQTARSAPAPARSAPAPARAASAAPPTYTFYSANALHPPVVWMSGTDPDPLASGDIFADSENSIQAGPLIYSPTGQLIWFGALHHAAAFNLEVQQYQGQSVLTYWQGYVVSGYGVGVDVILNHQYRTIATVHAANGLSADLHSFQLTPDGDALITAYEPVHADLSSVGGPSNGTVLDSVIQEINVATGHLVWQWHAFGHVHLAESYLGKPGSGPYDFFHINSVQQLPNGNLLVSARHTWALYEINPTTGRIPLVIGGKHSTVKMGPGTNFEWQHDAHMNADGTITMFDDGAGIGEPNERESRALRIRVNSTTRRATLVAAYVNNPSLLADSQGSVQLLPDGNTFVGWGSAPYFTEFSPSGKQLFSLHFGEPLQSYRAYRFQWWGQPTTPPSVYLTPTSQGTTAYASWNGATDVSAWRVLAGPNSSSLKPVGQFPRTNFETRMWVRSIQPYFEVQALGSAGQVLGTSAPGQP